MGTATTSFARGINGSTTVGTTSFTVTGNTIKDLTSNSIMTSTSFGVNSVQGICLNTGVNPLVSQNTIFNLSNSNATAVNTFVSGIGIASVNGAVIERNRIYGLSNASTATSATTPGSASGIFFRSAGTTTPTTVRNNMISLGNAQTNNTVFIGIWDANSSITGYTVSHYHNSINISGTATSGALPSFAYLRGDLGATARTQTVDLKNNIFVNTRTGGTGKHYAIANNFGATASATGWAANVSNFNVLNANATTVGYWTSDRTFATWQTASAGDSNSQSGVTINYTCLLYTF